MKVPKKMDNGTRSGGGKDSYRGRHSPVLLTEVIKLLAPEPGHVYCDLTLGAAGHLREMLGLISPGGIAVGVDRDQGAIEYAKIQLQAVSYMKVEMHLCHGGFDEIQGIISRLGLESVDRVLMDLGISSDQLDDPERGFSFLQDGKLDMRQDKRQSLTAADIVNDYSEDDLIKILQEYGDERFARRIAKAVVERRNQKPIIYTQELVRIIEGCVPGQRGKSHPATRTFQALRIEVGDEMGQLKRALPQVAELLSDDGRLAIITFHSLEDKVVKGSLRPFGRHGERTDWQLNPLGKVIKPSQEEIRGNPRSRSAKLRVYQKVRVEKD